MSDIIITREDGELKGRYAARIEGIDAVGEIEITYPRPGLISANHTRVPEVMGGRGVAGALLNFMLDDARKNGFKIVPVCPYVRGQYSKHPEWADLFTTRPGEDPTGAQT
jgi:predicted GNAT family acetyltransferase